MPFWLFIRPLGLVEQAENAAIGSLEDELADMGELACLVVYRPDEIDAEGLKMLEDILASVVEPKARFVWVHLCKAGTRHFKAAEDDLEKPLNALVAQRFRIVLQPDERIFHGTVSSKRRRVILASQQAWRQACERLRQRGNAESPPTTGARP
ncbi:MAG: hypothetical protein DI527_00925 [Chelatococcus sp.]|nr:MAG: hypothetical protein DI527_00925 [Chelatococcus sp.]